MEHWRRPDDDPYASYYKDEAVQDYGYESAIDRLWEEYKNTSDQSERDEIYELIQEYEEDLRRGK